MAVAAVDPSAGAGALVAAVSGDGRTFFAHLPQPLITERCPKTEEGRIQNQGLFAPQGLCYRANQLGASLQPLVPEGPPDIGILQDTPSSDPPSKSTLIDHPALLHHPA